MAWKQELSKKYTDHPGAQPVVAAPANGDEYLKNAGILYAKAGACFEGIYTHVAAAADQKLAASHPASQDVIADPKTADEYLQNAGNFYAKAAACFEGIYSSIAMQQQQGAGRSA